MNDTSRIRKGIFYYLIMLVGMMVTYPIATYGPVAAFVYQIIITTTFVFGIYLVGNNPVVWRAAVGAAVLSILAGIPYNMIERPVLDLMSWHILVALPFFGGFITFQLLLIHSLLRYIFTAAAVTKDVLYSAIATYLLIATTFTPIFSAIEFFEPGAFAVGYGDNIVIEWQQLVYYSLATLTTLGYGDIVPVNIWAKAIAALEAVIGVLYIAILMARLVSLYQNERQTAEETADH